MTTPGQNPDERGGSAMDKLKSVWREVKSGLQEDDPQAHSQQGQPGQPGHEYPDRRPDEPRQSWDDHGGRPDPTSPYGGGAPPPAGAPQGPPDPAFRGGPPQGGGPVPGQGVPGQGFPGQGPPGQGGPLPSGQSGYGGQVPPGPGGPVPGGAAAGQVPHGTDQRGDDPTIREGGHLGGDHRQGEAQRGAFDANDAGRSAPAASPAAVQAPGGAAGDHRTPVDDGTGGRHNLVDERRDEPGRGGAGLPAAAAGAAGGAAVAGGIAAAGRSGHAETRHDDRTATTGDVSGRAGTAAGAPAGGPGFGDHCGAAAPTGAAATTDAERLMPVDRAQAYGSRWNEVKGEFVDEPRAAVRKADQLVGEVLDEIEKLFKDQRAQLESDLNAGGDASTEELRQALQRYRSFFDRLLQI